MKKLLLATTVLAALCLVAPAKAQANPGAWVGSWSSAQQIPEPQNALPEQEMTNATIRQIVHLSIGGPELRVHLSNAFGTEPLHFTSVHIARPLSAASPDIDPASDRALTFSGKSDVTVPAGAEYISDPISYPVAALSNLAISFHLNEAPARETSHPGSRSTSYYLHGDQVASPKLPGAKTVDHWFQIAGVDVLASPGAASIVALGDSITDGHASTTNGNDRWTDVLAERLQNSAATRDIGVLNAGIGGNHLLTDGLGPNALARFDRDVLAQAGVRWLIVFEGINDVGRVARDPDAPAAEHRQLVRQVIAAYEQMIARAHAHGILVIGGTLMPFAGSEYYHPAPAN